MVLGICCHRFGGVSSALLLTMFGILTDTHQNALTVTLGQISGREEGDCITGSLCQWGLAYIIHTLVS